LKTVSVMIANANNRAKLQAGDGDDGHQRILQRVAENGSPASSIRARVQKRI